MSAIPDKRGANLPSGGVPVMVPDLVGVAPVAIRARVEAERAGALAGQRDGQGRPQVCFMRASARNGGGLNRVTLPRFLAVERMAAKEKGEG